MGPVSGTALLSWCLLHTTAALEMLHATAALERGSLLPAQLRGHQRVRVHWARPPQRLATAHTSHRTVKTQRSVADDWDDWGLRTRAGSDPSASVVDPDPRDPDMDGVDAPYSTYSPLLASVNKELAAARQRRREEYRNCSELRAQSLRDIEASQQEVYELKTADDDNAGFATDGAAAKLRVEKRKEQLQSFVAKCSAREQRLREKLEDVDRHKVITQGMLDDTNCEGAQENEIPNCAVLRQQMEELDADVDAKKARIEREIVEVQENCTKNKPLYEEAVVKAEEDAAQYNDQMVQMVEAKEQREEAIQSKSAELEQQQDAFEGEMKTCQENIRAHGKEIEELQAMKAQLEKLDSRESDDTADFDPELNQGNDQAAANQDNEQAAANQDNEQAAANPQPRPADVQVLPGESLRFEPPTQESHDVRNTTRELRDTYPDFKDPGQDADAQNVASKLAEEYPEFKEE